MESYNQQHNQEAFIAGEISQDDKTMAILAHILTLVACFIAPLVVYLSKKDNGSYFLLENAKESLNFQISLIIYFTIAFILVFMLIGMVIIPLLGIFATIVIIVATIKAANGEVYRYPLSIRFIK